MVASGRASNGLGLLLAGTCPINSCPVDAELFGDLVGVYI